MVTWYDAKEVAKYIITVCFTKNILISNLQLQKMLYFLWVEYWKKNNRKLFLEEFCAWPLGPVIPDVYYEYCSYAGRAIAEYYETSIAEDDKKVLYDVILKYAYLTASQLVDMTHKEGGAWDTVYQNGKGNRNVIPFELIIAKEAS